MAYLRWSNSCWYVYWDSESGDTVESQILVIDSNRCSDHSSSFSFEDILGYLKTDNLDQLFDSRYFDPESQYKTEHLSELRQACLQWVHEVLYYCDDAYKAAEDAKNERIRHWAKWRNSRKSQERLKEEQKEIEDKSVESAASFVRYLLNESPFSAAFTECTSYEEKPNGG